VPDELAELRSAAAVAPERWPQTRMRLEQLLQAHPGDTRYLMALAGHLALREPSRREALRQFQALAQQEPGNQAVRSAWRQALLALSPREGDEPLFTAYLAGQPGDAAVAERLNALRRSTGTAAGR
jgi:predicted Zn-dependent protease